MHTGTSPAACVLYHLSRRHVCVAPCQSPAYTCAHTRTRVTLRVQFLKPRAREHARECTCAAAGTAACVTSSPTRELQPRGARGCARTHARDTRPRVRAHARTCLSYVVPPPRTWVGREGAGREGAGHSRGSGSGAGAGEGLLASHGLDLGEGHTVTGRHWEALEIPLPTPPVPYWD